MEFDAANPKVWEAFVHYAGQLLSVKGRKHYSARTIIERIRWDVMLRTTSQDEEPGYKIANAHSAFYARKWAREFPDKAHLFKMHESLADVDVVGADL